MIAPEIWETVIAGIRNGLTQQDACIFAGVLPNTFYVKMANDAEFKEQVKQANVKFKLKHLRNVSNDPSWQSSAWLLERKFKEEFGKTLEISSGDEGSGGPKMDYSRLTLEERRILLRLERKATVPEEEVASESDFEEAIIEEPKQLE